MCAQDNVALIAVLEALDPPHPEAAAAGRRQLICVANTHIHANPELNDVKLWQARRTPFSHACMPFHCAPVSCQACPAWPTRTSTPIPS
jgi:hypothetical protein